MLFDADVDSVSDAALHPHFQLIIRSIQQNDGGLADSVRSTDRAPVEDLLSVEPDRCIEVLPGLLDFQRAIARIREDTRLVGVGIGLCMLIVSEVSGRRCFGSARR